VTYYSPDHQCWTVTGSPPGYTTQSDFFVLTDPARIPNMNVYNGSWAWLTDRTYPNAVAITTFASLDECFGTCAFQANCVGISRASASATSCTLLWSLGTATMTASPSTQFFTSPTGSFAATYRRLPPSQFIDLHYYSTVTAIGGSSVVSNQAACAAYCATIPTCVAYLYRQSTTGCQWLNGLLAFTNDTSDYIYSIDPVYAANPAALSWPTYTISAAAVSAYVVACSKDFRLAQTECVMSGNCLAIASNTTTNEWCWIADWGTSYTTLAATTIVAPSIPQGFLPYVPAESTCTFFSF
jgi:hypothetical protein